MEGPAIAFPQVLLAAPFPHAAEAEWSAATDNPNNTTKMRMDEFAACDLNGCFRDLMLFIAMHWLSVLGQTTPASFKSGRSKWMSCKNCCLSWGEIMMDFPSRFRCATAPGSAGPASRLLVGVIREMSFTGTPLESALTMRLSRLCRHRP